nr:DUF4126 domain-containing protein [Ardenticatena sp.]
MDFAQALLTGFGISSAAGLNAYIPLLLTGLIARYTSLVELREPYTLLEHPAVLLTLGILLVIEMGADKIAFLDSLNDLVNTIVRPSAGAMLFAATNGAAEMDTRLALVLGVLAAGSVHAAKSSVRPVVTAVSGGCANPLVSLLEDVVAFVLVLLAIFAPLLIAFWMGITLIWLIRWRRQREYEHIGAF